MRMQTVDCADIESYPQPDLSRVLRKPDVSICENKDAYWLRSIRSGDQRLCFHYIDRTISLSPKSEISNLFLSSVLVQLGLCLTCSETPKTGFLMTRSIHTVKFYASKVNVFTAC